MEIALVWWGWEGAAEQGGKQGEKHVAHMCNFSPLGNT